MTEDEFQRIASAWLRRGMWKPQEAARLLAEQDPVRPEWMDAAAPETGLAHHILDLMSSFPDCRGERPPAEWIEWAEAAQLHIHPALTVLILRDSPVERGEDALKTLSAEFARLDLLAVALAWLNRPEGEVDGRRIERAHGLSRWIRGLGLTLRYSDGIPASQAAAAHVAGTDARESQYLRVSDVRSKAAEAGIPWPDQTQVAQGEPKATAIDVDKLATTSELVAAFGPWTGMVAEWFSDLRGNHPLKLARVSNGKAGRKHVEPMFDVDQVYEWLASGRPKFKAFLEKKKTLNKIRLLNLYKQKFPLAWEKSGRNASDSFGH